MIYLDNSATTALCPEAIAAMRQVMEDIYGNPSSLHAVGLEAEKIVTAYVENVCENILENTAVFKRDEQGKAAFGRFLKVCGLTK